MTREEAIFTLKKIKVNCVCDAKKAIDMAIEALEKENMVNELLVEDKKLSEMIHVDSYDEAKAFTEFCEMKLNNKEKAPD